MTTHDQMTVARRGLGREQRRKRRRFTSQDNRFPDMAISRIKTKYEKRYARRRPKRRQEEEEELSLTSFRL